MTAPAPQCQPKGETLRERLRTMPSSLNDACRTMDEADEEIGGLREANHHYRDSAARDEKLIAALTARIEELTFQLDTSRLSVHNAEVENDRRADRIEELEKALRFYADGRRYRGANQQPIADDLYAKPDAVYILDVTRDGGSIARAVLQPKGAV